MSNYFEELHRLKSFKCIACRGYGRITVYLKDGITTKDHTCLECTGTGFTNGIYSSHIIINKPPRDTPNE